MARRTLVSALALLLLMPASAQAAQSCGKASWYELTSKTASGERANPNEMTAAHRTLPFGTRVAVTNLRNGRTIKVRINDRGPFIKGRIIDVTRAAALKLGFKRAGWAPVRIKVDGSTTKLTAKGC